MTETSRRQALTASLGLALTGAALARSTPVRADQTATAEQVRTRYKTVQIDGLKLFYREAGSLAAPALADRYHVVAPDYPGFGYSDFPDREKFGYSFAAYADIIDKFTQAIGLRRYALYIQDYGAPVGLRLALRAPERVTALIVQNGNAYEEGLSDAWDPIKAYWREPTPANRDKLRGWLTLDGTRQQYTTALSEAQVELVSPDSWMLDWSLLSRPGNIDLQLDLFGDYQSNVALYPQFQAFFREHRPPTLIVWGRN